jgi:hypothetical protein
MMLAPELGQVTHGLIDAVLCWWKRAMYVKTFTF